MYAGARTGGFTALRALLAGPKRADTATEISNERIPSPDQLRGCLLDQLARLVHPGPRAGATRAPGRLDSCHRRDAARNGRAATGEPAVRDPGHLRESRRNPASALRR